MEECQGNDKEGRPAQKGPQKKKRPAPKRPHVTTSPSQTGDAAERQDETRKVEDQKKDEVEDIRKDVEMDTDDEEKRQMGHSDDVTQTQRPHNEPNNQGASHSLNSVLKDPEMHHRGRNAEEDASVNVVDHPEDSCEQHLDEETKTEKQKQRATECQSPVETTSEDLTEFKGEQGEDIGPEKLKGDENPNTNTDDEETTQMGHSAEDEGQMKEDRKEERLQARGEEGDEENVETDTSINNHTTVREVKSSEDEEAQENKDSNTRENSKSEELNETGVTDVSVNVVEQSTDSCEQHLDEETKTEKEEQRVTPPQRRHHGLYNQGATCYLNSVLQVLFMTTEIHDRLVPQTDQELIEIFTDLKRKTCGTENITKSLKIQNVHERRDAAECLQEILHHISPEASEVFQGQLRHTTKCSKDHIINEETNPFWTLPLSLKDTNDTTYSVESSFERTFQTKTYSSGNMMYCNDCEQKTEATSRCEMVKAPQILILLLKRFDFDYNTRSHFKSDCCVEVPCELQWEKKTYKLYGMVNHMGSIRGGHYTATVLSEDNTWYECNDSHVSKVKHQLFAEDRTFSSSTVYLLTYRATELDMSCKMRQNEEDEVQIRNGNEELNPQTEGEEDNTAENSNDKSGGLMETNSKNSCEQCLDEEAKTEWKKLGVTPPQKPYYGLYNQGATCYLNSVLQVLFMTTEIHDRLNQQTDQELRRIFTDLKRKTCGTENITKSLKIQNVHEQRDAAECLQEILHHISPEASEVFQGQLRHTTKCSKDHNINEETNPFWTLPLSLKDTNDLTYSVESSFERTFQPKTYSSGNLVYCNDCKQKTEATSRCEMVEAPQILILLLKRFDFDCNTMSHFKSDCCVEVPCELQWENKTYKLYGMVNHMGSIRGGHYTATVLSEDNTWYECNDSHVSKIKHQLFAEDRTFSSRNVYLLMYRASELEMSCKNELNKEDAEDPTEENSKDRSGGLKKTNSENFCEQRPKHETMLGRVKNWFISTFSPSRATECQKPVQITSECLKDKVKEEQGKDIGPEEPKEPKEPKRNSKRNTDDEKTTQVGHSAEDEGKMREDKKEERLQARGEEGDEENVETDTSINNHTTGSEVKSSEDEEAKQNDDSNTRENSESEEFLDTRL